MRTSDAEKGILGIMLRYPETVRETVSQIRANDFSELTARQTFEAIKALAARGSAVDLITVDGELQTRTGNAVDTDYLIDCTQTAISRVSMPDYIRIVRGASERRRVVSLANRLAEVATDEEVELEEPIAKAVEALKGIHRAKGEWKSAGDVLIDAFEDADKMANGSIVPCVSGLPNLDEMTGGFFPGEMTILAARPSVGKTAMGLFMAISSALKRKNVAFVSSEMISQQIGKRMLADAANVNGMRLRNPGVLNDADWSALNEALVTWGELPMQMLFERCIEDIVSQVRRLHDRKLLDMLVVDYLQLLTSRRKFESNWIRIGYISQELKALSTELEIPVIALAQVSRDGARNGMPGLDSLRGSGDMEQDADNVIILHRPESQSDTALNDKWRSEWSGIRNAGKDMILLNVCKQRQGMCGVVAAVYDAAHNRYAPVEGR